MGVFLNRLQVNRKLSFKWMFHPLLKKNFSNGAEKDESNGTQEPPPIKKGVPSSKQQSIQEESYFNRLESEQLENLKKKKQEESEDKEKEKE